LGVLADMLANALQATGQPSVSPVTLADIGTDHAGLLIDLVRAGRIERGIGVEIAQGPYQSALANVAAQGLADRIEIRLGDGLGPVALGEATACAIAGMGGKTIVDILKNGSGIAVGMLWLLLQPMSQEKEVRLYLQQNGWMIDRETLTEERGILYTAILARRGEMKPMSDVEAEFGPLLLAEKPPLWELAVRQKTEGLSRIVDQLSHSDLEASRVKRVRLQERIRQWEALLP